MNSDADAASDANRSGDAQDDRTAPAQIPLDAGVDAPTLSSAVSHVVYDPSPMSRADIARQQRAVRRVTRQRRAPSWAKKISWILFPYYGFMRLHDPNYEEHSEQWEEQRRKDYDGL